MGSPAISRSAAGDGIGFAAEGSALIPAIAGGNGEEGLFTFPRKTGSVEEDTGVGGGCLSGRDTDSASISVTRRARRIAGDRVADPTRETSPPRRRA
jgi:hypothetical protein